MQAFKTTSARLALRARSAWRARAPASGATSGRTAPAARAPAPSAPQARTSLTAALARARPARRAPTLPILARQPATRAPSGRTARVVLGCVLPAPRARTAARRVCRRARRALPGLTQTSRARRSALRALRVPSHPSKVRRAAAPGAFCCRSCFVGADSLCVRSCSGFYSVSGSVCGRGQRQLTAPLLGLAWVDGMLRLSHRWIVLASRRVRREPLPGWRLRWCRNLRDLPHRR